MRIVATFKCEKCDKYHEQMTDSETESIKCDCGGDCQRMLSAPKYFGNSTGRSPSAVTPR